jgi:PPE-repeat protein
VSGFELLPPEITSAQIYAGPGSASFMAAAAAWNGVAAEMSSGALGLNQVITQLSGEEWLGPASAAMVSAAQPYLEWMTTTATQAEEAAAQAQSAAAAYETVLGSITPPPYIAVNRAELAQAMATNVLGQNNNIISQLEAQYQEFWATNTAAMFNYANQSAAATKLTAFGNAPTVANPAAASTQAAANTTTSAASVQQTLQKSLTDIQTAIGQLSTPAGTAKLVGQIGAENPLLTQVWFLLTGSSTLPTSLGAFVNGYSPYASFFYNTEGLPYFSVGMGNFGTQISKTLGWIGGAAAPAAAAVPKGLPGLGGLLGGGAGAAAHLGSATSIGKLSVPATWAGSVQAAAPHATAIPVSSVSAAPEAGGAGNLLGGMPLAGVGSGAGSGAGPRYGFRPTVMARPPLGG